MACMRFALRGQKFVDRPYKQSVLHAAQIPTEVFCILSMTCQVFAFLARRLGPPKTYKLLSHYTAVAFNLSLRVCIGWFAYRVVNELITRYSRGIARKSDILGAETSRQESQVLAVGQTARVLVILATGVLCLPTFHVQISTVLSFCGVGGLAISLLSKGLFVNLIGSLTIYLTQPFTLGDWIQTPDGDVDGWVQSMGPYHTCVMRWDRRPLYIPNSLLMSKQIINASRMTNRRILMELPIRFSDLDKIQSILEDIRAFIENHKDLDPEQHRHCRFRDIGAHAAMIWVSCYTKGITLNDFVNVREDIILSIRNIMFKYGTTFATTLDREVRRVDSTGAFLSDGPPAADPYYGIGGSPGAEEEAYRKPQPLLASQKALLQTELKSLKQKQESLWSREKDIKDIEATVQRTQELLDKEQAAAASRREEVEGTERELDEALALVFKDEAALQAQESSIDASMDVLQTKEEALDNLVQSTRAKVGEPPSDLEEPSDAKDFKVNVAGFVEYQQEKLRSEKEVIEAERQILQEQMAEQIAGLDEDEKEKKKEEEEEEPPTQRSGELLGGE